MILWTIQPEDVYELINRTGVYRCDGRKKGMRYYREQYLWLADQMRRRIGPPPEGVRYPVWAWQRWDKDRLKPDLRAIRWFWGGKSNTFCRLEIEIPDEQILLSDFEGWAWNVLNRWLICYTEHECDEMEMLYASLTPEGQKFMLEKNRERIFNIEPFDNGFARRGEIVQATFWELRLDQIRKVTRFASTRRKEDI